MNARLEYELRGWAYWAKCANPFRDTITIRNLPLGLTLHAYKRDAVGRGLYRRKTHEPAFTKLLLTRFANPGERNFIDAGANLGYFTCIFSKLAGPSGKVLAVEPEPRNLKVLRQNVAANHLTNVEIYPCALGSTDGSAMLGLYRGVNRGRHSIVEQGAGEQIAVPVMTLDAISRESGKNVKSWSFVKIDVEGFEGFALEGARETLPRIETLFVEFSPWLQKKAGGDPASALGLLGAHFTRVYRLDGAELVKVPIENCLRGDETVELVLER